MGIERIKKSLNIRVGLGQWKVVVTLRMVIGVLDLMLDTTGQEKKERFCRRRKKIEILKNRLNLEEIEIEIELIVRSLFSESFQCLSQ